APPTPYLSTLSLHDALPIFNLSNDKGQTALFGAVYMGSPLLVQLLVEHGAKIDVRNSKGQTPWSVAALGEYRAGSFFVKKAATEDRKSTRLNSSHRTISYAV